MTLEPGYLQFKRLTEVKTKSGVSNWAASYVFQPCLLEDINITTLAAYEKIEESSEPQIVPMGIKSCVCRISGKFKTHMILDCVNHTTVSSEVTDEDLLNTTETDANGNVVRIALKVNEGLSEFPELAGIWAINAFTWDRDAKTLGSYRFTMELSYVYVDPTESRIYLDDTASASNDNVKFIATTGSDAYFEIFDTKIHETLNDINSAIFSTVSNRLFKDDIVKIYKRGDTSTIAFHGYVKNVINNRNGTYTYECKEIGYCMYEMPVIRAKGGIFKSRIIIHNPTEGHGKLKIKDFIKAIMGFYTDHPRITYEPGTPVCRAGSLYDSEVIPGKDIDLPSMIISGKTIGKALDDFVENTCGFNLWFNRINGTPEYGFIRDAISVDPTKEFILSTEKVEDDNALAYAPDVVVVWNADATAKGIYPKNSNYNVGKITVMNFRLSSNIYHGSLDAFAERIYRDAHVTTDIFRVKFPPGTVRFKEGDYFSGLGDQTVKYKMTYKSGSDANPLEDPTDSVWKITDVVITESGTDVIVGPSYFSIFDIYKTSLSTSDGVPTVSENITETTGSYITKTISSEE